MAHGASNSRTASNLSQREILDILEGNLLLEHCPAFRNVRIFLSSGYTDCKSERQALHKTAFPALRTCCESLGFQFYVVDLFRCLSIDETESKSDDATLTRLEREGLFQLAIKEIKLCQQVSAGPNFVTLLAQRYGHRSLCTHIEEDDFKLMCSVLEDPVKEIVCQWYRRNDNTKPPQYELVPSREVTEKATEPWSTTHEALSKAIRRAAKTALSKDPVRAQKYLMSALEKEVIAGIFNIKANPNEGCYWIKRTFTDLYEQRGNDPALVPYADLILGKRGLEFDVETVKTLNHLKEARMCAKYVGLESENIFEFPLKWQKNKGLDPEGNPSHSAYLESLCQKFTAGLRRRIGEKAAFMAAMDGHRTYQEVLHQGAYCRRHAITCLNRSALSTKIQSYLDGGLNKPLVIHGISGSGKTTVMAAAAYRLRERSPLTKSTIVVRFLGTTPSSSSIRQTLKSISEQLSIVYNEDLLDIPADYRGIVEHFLVLLRKASPTRPIFIFLDAVDRLSPEDGALGMSWLPSTLPSHVKVVLSTSSEPQYGCYPVLCGLLCGTEDCFLEVPRLSQTECEEFLSHHLSTLHTQLSPHQHDVALQTLLLCPLPLYLQLMMKDISCWTSGTIVTMETFCPTSSIEGMIEHLFKQVELAHPVAMVPHILGYISAAKYGLSEAELMDILVCDGRVMSELEAPPPPLPPLPPLLWAKVYHHLEPLLGVGVGVGGAAVLRWGYRKVWEVAQARYLGDKETRTAKFRLLADYFGGKAKCQGYQGNQRVNINHQPLLLDGQHVGEQAERRYDDGQHVGEQAERRYDDGQHVGEQAERRYDDGQHVGEQAERHYDDGQHVGEQAERRYNVRKLRELPYSLASSNRLGELTTLLMDFRWIQACVLATSYADVIEDFANVIPVVPLGRNGRGSMYRDVRLLSEALALSSDALNADPTHLCTQLIGRLLPYATPSGENRPLLKSILQQAIEDTHPVLVPINPFFRVPGGPFLSSMEGHRGTISCVTSSLTTDDLAAGGVASVALFSSSWDNSLKSWDLRTGGVAKTFDGHTDRVLCVASSTDGMHVVSGSRDMSIRYWEACTGHCLSVMRGHTAEVNAVVMTTDGSKAASGSADNTIMVWNVDRKSSTFGQLVFTLKPLKSSVLSMALSQDDRHLAAGAKDGTVMILDIVSGEVQVTLKEQGPITALGLTQLDRSSALTAGSGNGGIKVWDFPSGELMHCLAQGGQEYPIASVSAGPSGRLVTVCNKIPSVWDIRTGRHLYTLTDCTGTTCVHVTDEGRLVVTGSEDQRVRIWDLETTPTPQTTKILAGNVRTTSVSPCGVYCAVGGEGGAVVVCELDTLKAVRKLEGHGDRVNHIVVLRDARTVVTAAGDGLVRLWDGEEGKCLRAFKSDEGEGAEVTCVAVSQDGALLLSGDRDGKVAVWSTKSGKGLRVFADHKRTVVAVGFAKGSTHHCMVSASADGVLCVRDFTSGKVVTENRLHKEELTCLALSPDSAFLVTGSRDRSARVVPLPSGLPLVALSGHRGAVTCAAVFSDCKTCLTGSEDRTLRVWSAGSGRCLGSMFVDDAPLACAVSRNFTILYGARHGWVSTASYLSGSGTPNPVLKKLQGLASVSVVDEAEALDDLDGSPSGGGTKEAIFAGAGSSGNALSVTNGDLGKSEKSVVRDDREDNTPAMKSVGHEKIDKPLGDLSKEPLKSLEHGGLDMSKEALKPMRHELLDMSKEPLKPLGHGGGLDTGNEPLKLAHKMNAEPLNGDRHMSEELLRHVDVKVNKDPLKHGGRYREKNEGPLKHGGHEDSNRTGQSSTACRLL